MAMTTSKTGYRSGHFALPAGVFVAPSLLYCQRYVERRKVVAALEANDDWLTTITPSDWLEHV